MSDTSSMIIPYDTDNNGYIGWPEEYKYYDTMKIYCFEYHKGSLGAVTDRIEVGCLGPKHKVNGIKYNAIRLIRITLPPERIRQKGYDKIKFAFDNAFWMPYAKELNNGDSYPLSDKSEDERNNLFKFAVTQSSWPSDTSSYQKLVSSIEQSTQNIHSCCFTNIYTDGMATIRSNGDVDGDGNGVENFVKLNTPIFYDKDKTYYLWLYYNTTSEDPQFNLISMKGYISSGVHSMFQLWGNGYAERTIDYDESGKDKSVVPDGYPKSVPYGEIHTVDFSKTHNNSMFLYWAANGNKYYSKDNPTVTITDDITFKAVWQDAYKVTYNVGDLAQSTLIFDSSIESSNIQNNIVTVSAGSETKIPQVDLSKYISELDDVSIKLYAKGGTIVYNEKEYSSAVNKVTLTMKSAQCRKHVFNYWYLKNNNSIHKNPGDTYVPSSNVEFLMDVTKNVNVKASISIPKPDRDGYTFKGWSTVDGNKNFIIDDSANYIPSSNDVYLYAIWEPIHYVAIKTDSGYELYHIYIYNSKDGLWDMYSPKIYSQEYKDWLDLWEV